MRKTSAAALWIGYLAAVGALLAVLLAPPPPPVRAQSNQLYNLAAALATNNAAISLAAAATTQIVAVPPTATQSIYVMSENFIVGNGASNPNTFQWVAGTGVNCATGQTTLTGSYSFNAQSGIAMGSGFGPVLIVPAGNALCATTTGTTVAIAGNITYRVF